MLGGAVRACQFLLRREYAAAESHFREALELYRAQLGAEHPTTASTVVNLAYTLQQRGEWGAAVPLYEEAIGIFTKKLPPDHPSLATCRSDLGDLFTELGRYREAREQLVAAYTSLQKTVGRDHEQTKRAAARLRRLRQVWKSPEASAEIRSLLGT